MNNLQSLLPMLVLFAAVALMLFFSTRKQKARAAASQAMQDSIVPGTRVMTTSGLHGTVTAVADDTIELEVSPGVRTTWIRAAVREVVVPAVIEPLDPADSIDPVIDSDTAADGSVHLDKRRSDLN